MIDESASLLINHLKHSFEIVVGNLFDVEFHLLKPQMVQNLFLQESSERSFNFWMQVLQFMSAQLRPIISGHHPQAHIVAW